MNKGAFLIPIVLLSLTSCGTINKLNCLVNASTDSIYQNAAWVEISTERIRENTRIINESTRAIEENQRHIEAMANS
jgi:hypothetical protein